MDLKASSNANSKNNFDAEKSSLEKLEADAKNAIFGVLFVILKDEDTSIVMNFAFYIIQFLQITLFAFHRNTRTIWGDTAVVDTIDYVLNTVEVVYYFEQTNWDVYITFLYIGIGVLIVIFIDILYIIYAFNKKRFSFQLPIYILKMVVLLITTILFQPILDYFMNVMACVDNKDGVLVHHAFSEIECWTSSHIIHSVFAILAAIVYLMLTYVSVLCFFECKSTSNVPTARINARANFLFLLYQTVLIIVLTFLYQPEYQYIFLILIIGGSFILFYKFHYNSPYYNEIIAKLWSTLMAVNFWTAIMLTFAKFMEGTLFEGSIAGWLIGIPFIVLIVITNRDHRIDFLLINVNKFQSGEELQNQIRYLLKLVTWQATNKNAAILLDGYIEIHKQTCNKDDCPLKQKVIKNVNKNKLPQSTIGNEDQTNDKYALLIQLLNKMFFYGIKKFPNNTSLRIVYAFFLIEKMNLKQQAIQELNLAEQNKPPFDEQFIIYRYRRIVEDEIAESKNEGNGGIDVVSEIASQNHLRQMQANIEKSSILHMEFWSQLSEDTPDLAKLNDIGSKINSSVAYVEDHWNKLQKINENLPKAMKLYGRFLCEIINDKDGGDQQIERARQLISINSNKKGNLINVVGAEDISDNVVSSIFVSGDMEKLGLITGINLAAASLFGYNKSELLNRNIKILMPQIFMKSHDHFLETYMNTQEGQMINKERFVFGKNKSNYIFPFYIHIKAIQNNYQTLQFVATFRIEKIFKNVAYIIFASDGTIDGISSSCISMLKLDLKSVVQKKASIFDYFPNIIKDRNNFISKSGGLITYTFNKDDLNDSEENNIQLICTMQELVFQSIDSSVQGYSIRLEKIPEKINSSSQSQHRHHRKTKPSNFQFRYDRMKGIIIGEYTDSNVDDLQSEIPDGSQYLSQIATSQHEQNEEGTTNIHSTTHNFVSSHQNNNNNDHNALHQHRDGAKIDYSVGIKTLRVINSDIREIIDDRSDSEDENELNNEQKRQELVQDNEDHDNEAVSLREFKLTFKSRKILNNVIQDKAAPKSIQRLRWIANLLFIFLIAMAIADYFTTLTKFKDIKENASLINLADQRIAEMENILSKVLNLELIAIGLYQDENGTLADSYKKLLSDSLDNIKSIQKQLQLDVVDISLPKDLVNLLSSNVISMYYADGNTIKSNKYDLNEGVDQIIARTLSIMQYDLSNVTGTNSDVIYVEYNLFNDFYIKMREAVDLYVVSMHDKSISQKTIFLIFLLVTLGFLFLTLIILIPVLKHVNNAREEVLSLFLDIPEKTVKQLYQKCENFISSLQVGEDDDILSEGEEDMAEKMVHDDGDMPEIRIKRKRKRTKNSGRSQIKFFLKFLLGTAILSVYFFITYFLTTDLLAEITQIMTEYNSTCMAESFYYYVANAQKYMFINSTDQILNQDALAVNLDNIDVIYKLDSLIQEEHSVNVGLHTSTYNSVFNDIILKDPCPLITDYIELTECETFANGLVYQGLELALTRHFENLRYLLSQYVYYDENIGVSFEEEDENSTFVEVMVYADDNPEDITLNNKLNLLLLPEAIELDEMQNVYIKYLMRKLSEEFETGINDKLNSVMGKRLGIFLGFIMALGALYLLFWIPTVNKLNNDIWRTKSMLTMIPMNVVARISSVRMFIKKFLKDKHLSSD